MTRTSAYRMPISRARFWMIPSPSGQTTYGDMIWAFWELGVRMVQLYPMPQLIPSFSGTVETASGTKGTIGSDGPVSSSPLTMSNSTSDPLDSGITLLRKRDEIHGVIGVRGYMGLKIHYRVSSTAIDPGRAFTAFLKANTIFAVHNDNERGNVAMSAYSPDQRLSVSVKDVEEGSGVGQLTWGMTRLAMQTVWRDIILGFNSGTRTFLEEPKWQLVVFILEYHGTEVGTGYVA